jgi:hypothetical protein
MKRIAFILGAMFAELSIVAFYGTSQSEVPEAQGQSVTCAEAASGGTIAGDAKVDGNAATGCDAVVVSGE